MSAVLKLFLNILNMSNIKEIRIPLKIKIRKTYACDIARLFKINLLYLNILPKNEPEPFSALLSE